VGSEFPVPAVPAVVLVEENDHGSNYANNRTLADIFLDARHPLFIFSSSFLHVQQDDQLHLDRFAGCSLNRITAVFCSGEQKSGALDTADVGVPGY
jgi:hypothetical protein